MFISEAFAQTTEAASQGAAVAPAGSMIFQLVFIVFVVYFILIRPQQKRIKNMKPNSKLLSRERKLSWPAWSDVW